MKKISKLLTLEGLKIFGQALQDEFLTKSSADSIYSKKTDAKESGNFNQSEIENYIKSELEKSGWQEDGEKFTYGKIYRNVKPYIKLGGINSAENILVEEKSVTIPADNFDSATQITIESNGYSYSFGKSFNVKLEGKNTTLENSGGNDTIENFNLSSDKIFIADATAKITSAINESGTILTLTNGEKISTVFWAGIFGGKLPLNLGGTEIDFITGTDDADNLESSSNAAIIDAKGGDDTINLNGAVANLVNAGAGADKISIYGARNNTINAGAGNDSVDATTAKGGNLYLFGANDGNDSITGFSESDSIQITTQGAFIDADYSGDNYVVTVKAGNDSGTINLLNFAVGSKIQIFDAEGAKVAVGNEVDGDYYTAKFEPVTIEGTDANDTLYSSLKGAVIDTKAGTDTVSLDGAVGNAVSLGADSDYLIAYNGACNNTIYGSATDYADYVSLVGASSNVATAYYVYLYNGSSSNTINSNNVHLYDGSSSNTINSNYVYLYDGSSSNSINSNYVYLYDGSSSNSIKGKCVYLVASDNVSGGTNTITFQDNLVIYGHNDNNSIILPEGVTVRSAEFNSSGYDVSLSSGNKIYFYGYGGDKKLNIYDAEGNRVSVGVAKDDGYYTPVSVQANTVASAKITLSKGGNFLTNSGTRATIISNGNCDTIKNTANNVSILPGKYDSISNSGTAVTIGYAQNNSCTVDNSGANCRISVYSSDVNNTGSKAYIYSAQASSICNGADSVSVLGSNYDSVTSSGHYCRLSITSASDVSNLGDNCTVSVSGYSWSYNFTNSGSNCSISASNIRVTNSGDSCSIWSAGDTNIISSGNNTSINSSVGSNLNVSIKAGKHIIQKRQTEFATIYGFKADDSLKMTNGSYKSSQPSGKDLYIFTSGDTWFQLVGVYDDNGKKPVVNIYNNSNSLVATI